MSRAVPDELLSHFAVEGTWTELPGRIIERCSSLQACQVRPVLYMAGTAFHRSPEDFERFGEVARVLAEASTSS
jgi:hypothetical protein